ncbi:toll/interleukin-1 receptor domain-containing protein [Paenarthrobacter nicotinovorans]|uniref:toll/interleukin-1 receptor domain-containing protein n=1 Tax=Paenarthrobacter nicotinovorans TaxID=29320 RepID=UPI0024852228|nr:toll/interleukin-1 receptor domain-containing protein [Paenarthrobacter nicotinovorans]MDI2019608.1 hypothetical protein [Paenarthrobacter nicotinovorans]
MTRIFFSHASEDKNLVEAVYSEFVAAFPEHAPWVDKYEIVGGDSLITKIAEGMDQADKFFIFLSPIAVEKPWVQRELRRALMREIGGVDPAYIVPVKVGDLAVLPPFLEDKLYIDLPRMQKAEWLAQFDAAITGQQQKPGVATGNVDIAVEYGEKMSIARVTFTARAWAEEFAWIIAATRDIEHGGPERDGSYSMVREIRTPRLFGMAFETPELRPGKPITLRIHFQEGVDALAAIGYVAPWQFTAPAPEVH